MLRKPRMSKTFVASAVLLSGLLLAGGIQAQGNSGNVKQKSAEFSNSVFNREKALQQRKKVHDKLVAESVDEGLTSPINVPASKQEKADIDQASRFESPVRVGLTKSISRSVSFADLKSSKINKKVLQRGNGAMAGTDDGGYVYTSAVNSPDATAMRLHFRGFRLPANSGLYLFTDNGQVFGPYTGRGPHNDGEFWSHTLMGDHVIVQLRQSGPASDDDLKNTAFEIAGVAHIRERFLGSHCDNNASCVENVECTSNSAVDDARDAVAHMQWVSGPYVYFCSGGLIADTDTSTDRLLFLTANHCISRGKDARNLENFFQLTAPCGTNTCEDWRAVRDNHPQNLRTMGASILSTGKNQDYTLMELKGSAPDGSTFLGWNSAPVALTKGEDLYRVSHPDGSPQAFSSHKVQTETYACGGWPRGDRIYSFDQTGATEGGSSGSPVVNSAGEIVGQLSGACGSNLDDVCDSVNNSTVDGAFAAYFDDVSSILDPAGGGGGGGGDDGAPAGASCSVNSDCASNRCKGKRNNKTCK